MDYDVFISHASEDKDAVARPLALQLQGHGIKVWLDEFELTLGDSLRRTIDRGLSQSRFGIVILSQNFFKKDWPQRELDGLAAREENHQKVILPVWHNITKEEIIKCSPMLGDRLAVSTTEGIEIVAQSVLRALGKPLAQPPVQPPILEKPTVNTSKTSTPTRRVSKRVILSLLAGAIVILVLLPFLISRYRSAQTLTESFSPPASTATPSPTPQIQPSPYPETIELSNPPEAILKGCNISDWESRGSNIKCVVFNNFPNKRITRMEIELRISTPNGFQVIRSGLDVDNETISDEFTNRVRLKGLPLHESHYSGFVEYDYKRVRLHSKKFKVWAEETSRAF